MKVLLSASIWPDETNSSFVLKDISDCYWETPDAGVDITHYDWREHLKQIADKRTWTLNDVALNSVREAMIFLTQKDFFCSIKTKQIMDECSEKFGLPVGSAVLSNYDGPFFALFEGEPLKEI